MASTKGRPSKQPDVARWLKGYLAQGSRPASDVKNAAKGLGYSSATLNRAKAQLGVESVRRGAGFHWRDPDVLEEQVGSPNLLTAIQELTRAIRQLAKGSTVTPANAPIEPEDELRAVEPSPPADPEHLAETARNLVRYGKSLEAIKAELLDIAHNCPCNPPLSDDYVCSIAEKYGQRQGPPKSTRPPITEVLDDPVWRKAWIAGLPGTPMKIIQNEYNELRNFLFRENRDAKTDPAGKEMIEAYKADGNRRLWK